MSHRNEDQARPNRFYLGTMGDDPRPWVFKDTGVHTCGAGDEHGHEPHCGEEFVAPLEELVEIATEHWRRANNEAALERLGQRADAFLAGDPDALAPRVVGWDELLA